MPPALRRIMFGIEQTTRTPALNIAATQQTPFCNNRKSCLRSMYGDQSPIGKDQRQHASQKSAKDAGFAGGRKPREKLAKIRFRICR
jgi:hypothetical protein